MSWRSSRALYLAGVVILMLACAVPSFGPTPPPLPTFDPNAPLTAIVLTAGAAATQTAINAPPTATSTPLPTNTPSPTPTATPTFLFLVPTFSVPPTQIPLGVSDKALDCQVLSYEPKGLQSPSTPFKAKWILANIGKDTWLSANIDYRYESGDKLHLQGAYDFPANVQPGATVEVTVDMQTPSSPGEYTTTWRLYSSNKSFCTMELTITVN